MKKYLRGLALVLALVLALTLAAFAAEEGGKADIIIKNNNARVTFVDADEEKLTVTYTDTEVIEDGAYYMVVMVKGGEDGYTITKDSVLYIDQVTGDSSGSISFTVYPSHIEDSVILISGAGLSGESGPLIAAIIDAKFILGDVNGDKYVDTFDAIMILQSRVSLRELTAEQKIAANVDGDADIDVADAVMILQLIVGLIESF